MSFLGVFKSILHGADVAAHIAVDEAPLVSLFSPAAGALISAIGSAVLRAEALHPEPKSGPQKKQSATDELLPALRLAFAFTGRELPVEAVVNLSGAIDAMVAALNSVNSLSVPLKVQA